jgi:hypothetical protein
VRFQKNDVVGKLTIAISKRPYRTSAVIDITKVQIL